MSDRAARSGALVLCTGGGIGDVLLATPVMAALRARFGSVTALTTPAHAAVLERDPGIDAIWSLPPGTSGFVSIVRRAARERFAASAVTWATTESALIPALAGIPERAGQARRSYSMLFTKRVVVKSELGDRSTHWTQILLDYARALGADGPGTPIFVPTEADRAEARALVREIASPGAYAVFHPTRGIAGARARWPVGALARLGVALRDHLGMPIVVSGAEADRAIAERVADAAGGLSIAGRASIGAFGAVAAGARVAVALDSGPMHVAAAVGVPTVGIFALQTDEPDRWAPVGAKTAVVRGTYPCPPSHRKETCPDFACLRELDIARVLASVDGLLAR